MFHPVFVFFSGGFSCEFFENVFRSATYKHIKQADFKLMHGISKRSARHEKHIDERDLVTPNH